MRFKVDENLPVELAEVLQHAGHDAVTVKDQHLGGIPDSSIAKVCQQEHRALLTIDTDFADIRIYPPKDCAGLIVMRLNQQDKHHVLEVTRGLLPMFSTEPLDKQLWIVEEDRVRIRD